MNVNLELLFGAILLISIYNFYLLRKSKVKIKECISDTFTSLIINLIIAIIVAAIIGYFVVDASTSIPILIGILAIFVFSYFKFKGRKIVKGQIKKEKEIKEKKISPQQKLLNDIDGAANAGYAICVFSIIFIFFSKDIEFFSQGVPFILRFADPLIIAALAYWTAKKLSFYAVLIMTIFFIVGKIYFLSPLINAGYSGGAGIGFTIIFGYWLVKGTISAYKYNFVK
jgi:hypothetical protein|tara:strand:+ start:588 stop:1268 length:681 start_codon:yes stop_codon:yes gene_type:complete